MFICSYTYVLSALKKVTDTEMYGNNIRIMYDVGCKLRTALKKTPSLKDIEDVPIAVGIFHITGHNAACQVHFHPRLVKGFGMIDGESLERMWSYLNGFVSMTRTMTPLNRRLTVTIALEFLAEEKIDNIGML
ncbi:hypothetical protein BDB00DRAFT_774439 [Zychaea mexicana]|uniref:uncharacterized protein n=1 Tax=Zychaea mexicana TaxID=64656 RepID=UPI0022FEE1B3|nr:uncharacterized protein BDB00DRAFT_774439 [Zychaea mexicana]KAI9484713.1 hypothetical protein BDB00DRAFT_774439 [Zychaea mexicana]